MSPSAHVRLVILSLALSLSGCLEIPSTQVMAIFVADEEIAETFAEVELKVYGSSEGTAPELVATVEFTREDFPASVALIPSDPKDATREFGLEATALDEAEAPRAIVRARGRYMIDETRTAYLRFDSDCLDILHCSPDESCSLGRCIDAYLDDSEYGELDKGGDIALPPIARPDQYMALVGEELVINPLENDRDPADLAIRIVDVQPWDSVPGGYAPEIIDSGAHLRVSFSEYPGESVRYVYTIANERGIRARALIELSVRDRDSDGDGIPDHIERASGCLDYLNPDTDGDGIPDGVEDANRDGRVDPDETDPCRASSDGTGVCDGPWREVMPDGCHDFAVRFIDPSRPAGGDIDGLSWQTAFLSLEQAIDAEGGSWVPASRHYWIKEGELSFAPPLHMSGSQFQRVYGGFRGEEPSAAHREPHRWTRMRPIYLEPGVPLVDISEAQSLVVDGLAFLEIGRIDPGDEPAPPMISVVGAQSVRLSRLFFGEVEAEALIRALSTDDLTLQQLIVHRSRSIDEVAGLIDLENVEGKMIGSLFVNNPGEERLRVESIAGIPPIGPVVRLRTSPDAIARHFEIRESSFYANKSSLDTATVVDAMAPLDASAPNLRLLDLRLLLPAYAHHPSSAIHARGLGRLELLNVEIYDRSARSDDPEGFSGATDQTIRAYDVEEISIRHLTNDAEYIGPWNRLLLAASPNNARATRIRFEDNVSTLNQPIYDRDGVLDAFDVESRRYCETTTFDYSPELAPIPSECHAESGATGDALVQGLGLSISELSAVPGGRPATPPIAPGYHPRLAGPYLNSVTRGNFSEPQCAGPLGWSAHARGCLLLRRDALPLRLEAQGELASVAFLDALACFGEGPPVVNLPALEHACHPVSVGIAAP